jgi:hypothetical protein
MDQQPIMRFRRCWISLATSLLLLPFLTNGQVTVTGPTCVTPGTVYQYLITGNWNSASVMHVCVNGGYIGASVDSTCTPQGTPLVQVLVSWTTIGSGTLTVTSSLGNAGLNVTVIAPLAPGSIDSLSHTQMLAPGDTPNAITCSPALGGSCTPIYNYQWQRSPDRVSWEDMGGATNTALAIDTALTESTFYRR